MAKGVKTRHGETSAIAEQDTGKKVFVGTDSKGNMYIVTPKNKTEAKKFAREIKKTGTLKGVQYETAEEMTGFGRIEETEIEPKLVDGYGKPGVFVLPQPKSPTRGRARPARMVVGVGTGGANAHDR